MHLAPRFRGGCTVPHSIAGRLPSVTPCARCLCVGVAYFLIGVLVPLAKLSYQGELSGFTMKGSLAATLGGALGAVGAVCIIFAFRSGGLPTYVMPVVFAGAPLVNVLFSMWLHPPKTMPNPLLYVGFRIGGRWRRHGALLQTAGLVLFCCSNAPRFRSFYYKEIPEMRDLKVRTIGSIAFVILLSVGEAAAQAGGNWPQWRGPKRDGISTETGLLKQWPENGPPLAWKAKGAGFGYSSFAIVNGRLYTMGLRGDREYVIAFDVANGKEVWATAHGGAFRNDRGDGPRGTPTIEGDRLYALGGDGDLSALDVATGKIIWTMNVLKKFGGEQITWGISESPLIVGEKLLVNAWRTGSFSRGAEQEGRRPDLEESE